MFTVGLVVEGETDKAAIPELVKKCRKGANVVCRQCRGSVVGRVRKILDELDRRANVDKVLIICDADGNDTADIQKRISEAIADRRHRADTKSVVAVQSLEAWLLGDEVAVKKIARAAKTSKSPENLRDPKSELKAILSKARINYTPEVARRIAEGARVSVIAKCCPSFERFRQAVVDC